MAAELYGMAAARRCHRGWSLVFVTLSVAFTARGATGLRPRSPLKTNATMRSLVEADRRRLAAYNIDEVDKLTADAAAAGDSFGWSVAIAGNTVVVGAYQYNNGGSGVAYVLRTTDGGATYGQVAKLTAADAAAYDSFGYSVAIDGSTVVIGAFDNDGDGPGSAYAFMLPDPTPQPTTAALGSDAATRAGGTFLALLVAAVLAL